MNATENRKRIALDRCKKTTLNGMSERYQWTVMGIYDNPHSKKFSESVGGGLITTKVGKPETKEFVRRQVFQ
jgi:hypothetical protein